MLGKSPPTPATMPAAGGGPTRNNYWQTVAGEDRRRSLKDVFRLPVAKIGTKISHTIPELKFGDHSAHIGLIGLAGKICIDGTTMSFIVAKMVARIAKVDHSFVVKGGNINSLLFQTT